MRKCSAHGLLALSAKLSNFGLSHSPTSDCVLQRLSGKYELTEDRQLLTIAATDIGTLKTFGNPGVIKTVLRGVQALIEARQTAAKRIKEVESDQEDNI